MPSCLPRHAARRAALALSLLLPACGSDDVVSPVDTSAESFWALRLDRRAVTLGIAAPYDTLRLVATPVSSSGEPIEGPKPATFTTTNINTVAVHADGRRSGQGAHPGRPDHRLAHLQGRHPRRHGDRGRHPRPW